MPLKSIMGQMNKSLAMQSVTNKTLESLSK